MIHLAPNEIKNAHNWILEYTLEVLQERNGRLTENDYHRNTPGELFPGKIDAIIDNLLFPKDNNYLVCHRVSKFMYDVCTLHPYIEGNKRTAYFVSTLILAVNGLHFQAPSKEVERVIKQVAAGKLNQKAVEKWIKKRCKIQFVRAAPLFLIQAAFILFKRQNDIPWSKLGIKDNFLLDVVRHFVRHVTRQSIRKSQKLR